MISTSISYFLAANKMNYLLVATMIISPIVLLKYQLITRNGGIAIIYVLIMLMCPLLNHPESMRWSTVLFGILFCIFFISYDITLSKSDIKLDLYQQVLKYLIYAYCIVLIIQQFCVLTGLPIFNISNYSLGEKWKLNSLTSEPSHSSCVLGLLMFSFNVIYFAMKEGRTSLKTAFQDNKFVWIAFFWSEITIISASSVVYLSLILFQFINRRSILIIVGIIGLLLSTAYSYKFKPVERSTNLLIAATTLNEKEMIKTDLSGSLRFIPTIICLKKIDIRTKDGWFGHGIDSTSKFMSSKISGVKSGYSGGGMAMLGLEYGFLPFLLLSIFTLYLCYYKKEPVMSIIFWLLLPFLGGPNFQFTWSCIIILYSNKIFIQRAQQTKIFENKIIKEESW